MAMMDTEKLTRDEALVIVAVGLATGAEPALDIVRKSMKELAPEPVRAALSALPTATAQSVEDLAMCAACDWSGPASESQEVEMSAIDSRTYRICPMCRHYVRLHPRTEPAPVSPAPAAKEGEGTWVECSREEYKALGSIQAAHTETGYLTHDDGHGTRRCRRTIGPLPCYEKWVPAPAGNKPDAARPFCLSKPRSECWLESWDGRKESGASRRGELSELHAYALALEGRVAELEASEKLWRDTSDAQAGHLVKARSERDAARTALAEAEHQRDIHLQLGEKMKCALRMPGTGNYVDWAKECRQAVDDLAGTRIALAEAQAEVARGKAEAARAERLDMDLEHLRHVLAGTLIALDGNPKQPEQFLAWCIASNRLEALQTLRNAIDVRGELDQLKRQREAK